MLFFCFFTNKDCIFTLPYSLNFIIMRTKIVAGNWKMNLDVNESKTLAYAISEGINGMKTENTRIFIAPTAINLQAVVNYDKDERIEVAAQNMHQSESGAFTGEIAASMIQSIGVNTVILGHSERRTYFNETDATLAEKVHTALRHGMEVIFCFGEVLEDRKSNTHFKVVSSQLEKALFQLKPEDWQSIILAYEPVWAIGTGETATPEQAQEMHAFIRDLLAEHYTEEVAQKVAILYGGSVKPANAKAIFSQKDVDGGLIGGAALKSEDFVALIKTIQSV